MMRFRKVLLIFVFLSAYFFLAATGYALRNSIMFNEKTVDRAQYTEIKTILKRLLTLDAPEVLDVNYYFLPATIIIPYV